MKHLTLFVLLTLQTFCLWAGGYQEVATREGVKLPFFYEKPANAKAIVVLFQGGGGGIGVMGSAENGWIKRDKAFLSGGAPRFAKNNLVVAVVDAPTDRADLNSGFRNSNEHNQDIQKLVEFLRADNPGLPIWLIGTSNGSLTAVSASLAIKDKPIDGVVLTSTVTQEPSWAIAQRYTHPVYRADVSQVTVSVLIVHHINDRCKHSPYEPIDALAKSFKRAKKVEVITIEGGQDNSDPCNGGYHQFLGQEQEVTDQIAKWILK